MSNKNTKSSNKKKQLKKRKMLQGTNVVRINSLYPPAAPGTVTLTSPGFQTCIRVPMRMVVRQSLTSGSPVANLWNPNDLFKPYTGSSAQPTNFAQYAAQYAQYRVTAFSYEATMCNTEVFPVYVYVFAQGNTPGATPDITLTGNPLSQRYQLSAKGGQDRHTFRRTITLPELTGSQACWYSDNFQSLNNTSPADPVWLGFCAESSGGTSLTTGVTYEATITMFTEWRTRQLVV